MKILEYLGNKFDNLLLQLVKLRKICLPDSRLKQCGSIHLPDHVINHLKLKPGQFVFWKKTKNSFELLNEKTFNDYVALPKFHENICNRCGQIGELYNSSGREYICRNCNVIFSKNKPKHEFYYVIMIDDGKLGCYWANEPTPSLKSLLDITPHRCHSGPFNNSLILRFKKDGGQVSEKKIIYQWDSNTDEWKAI